MIDVLQWVAIGLLAVGGIYHIRLIGDTWNVINELSAFVAKHLKEDEEFLDELSKKLDVDTEKKETN